MILVADSGSTKTNWAFIGTESRLFKSAGINPFYQTPEQIMDSLFIELLPQLLDAKVDATEVETLYFYGAGCANAEKIGIVMDCLREAFPNATIEVASDLLGAARSLCQQEDGIACILGTGSNSCFFQNGKIAQNVPALGFILGDEGSGAVMCKYLIGDLLKNQLPATLQTTFWKAYPDLTPATILDKVYKQPFPNRFLASLCPFIQDHMDEPSMQALVDRVFTDFLVRNVQQYDYQHYPVHFTGSVAYLLQENLKKVAAKLGITVGKIVQDPLQGMLAYHAKKKD